MPKIRLSCQSLFNFSFSSGQYFTADFICSLTRCVGYLKWSMKNIKYCTHRPLLWGYSEIKLLITCTGVYDIAFKADFTSTNAYGYSLL